MKKNLLTAVLIDDEAHCLNTLRWNLSTFFPEINIVGEAMDGNDGFKIINEINPDVIFLDVEMPGMNGFEMLNKFDKINFKVIFITAHNEYAIRAIKLNAIDYLMKPIDKDELKTAILRLISDGDEITFRKIQNLKYNMNSRPEMQRIIIGTIDGYQFFDLKEITFFEADSNYSYIHFNDGTKVLSTKTLKEFEDVLPPNIFFRCHHSNIVNFQYIKKYIKGDGGEIELIDGKRIIISRRRKQEFIDWIGK